MSVEGTSAPILSLGQYLSGKDLLPKDPRNLHIKMPDRLLVVPPWQREYVWGATDEGEVGVLCESHERARGGIISRLRRLELISYEETGANL